MLSNELLQLLGVHELPAGKVQDLGGGPQAEIGGEQGGLQFLEQARIDLLSARQHVSKPGNQPVACLLDTFLQSIEQAGFLGRGTEKGLDHGG